MAVAQTLPEYIPVSKPGRLQSDLDCKKKFHLYELCYFIIWTLSPNHHLSELLAVFPGLAIHHPHIGLSYRIQK